MPARRMFIRQPRILGLIAPTVKHITSLQCCSAMNGPRFSNWRSARWILNVSRGDENPKKEKKYFQESIIHFHPSKEYSSSYPLPLPALITRAAEMEKKEEG